MPAPVRGRRVPRLVTAVLVALALAFGTLGLVATPAQAASKSRATNAEFNKIKNGQTLSQVRGIIDSSGERLAPDLYRWKSTKGRYVFVYFEDGKVVGKQRSVVASLSEYKKIKRGNSYNRVKKIIGGPSQYSFQDNEVRYRVWLSPDLRNIITVAFDHGKVIGKERNSGGAQSG
jgi:hypothetical protein